MTRTGSGREGPSRQHRPWRRHLAASLSLPLFISAPSPHWLFSSSPLLRLCSASSLPLFLRFHLCLSRFLESLQSFDHPSVYLCVVFICIFLRPRKVWASVGFVFGRLSFLRGFLYLLVFLFSICLFNPRFFQSPFVTFLHRVILSLILFFPCSILFCCLVFSHLHPPPT